MTDYNIAYSELTDTYYITQNGEKVSDCTNQIQSIAEAEHKAMCESCIHKVSADDLRAIKYNAIDELSNRCTTHIKQSKPLTIEEIIHIIHFEADQMKGE